MDSGAAGAIICNIYKRRNEAILRVLKLCTVTIIDLPGNDKHTFLELLLQLIPYGLGKGGEERFSELVGAHSFPTPFKGKRMARTR